MDPLISSTTADPKPRRRRRWLRWTMLIGLFLLITAGFKMCFGIERYTERSWTAPDQQWEAALVIEMSPSIFSPIEVTVVLRRPGWLGAIFDKKIFEATYYDIDPEVRWIDAKHLQIDMQTKENKVWVKLNAHADVRVTYHFTPSKYPLGE